MRIRPRMFLLDENMPRKVLSVLRTAGYAATRVYDAGLRSQPDTAIFAHARSSNDYYHLRPDTNQSLYFNLFIVYTF